MTFFHLIGRFWTKMFTYSEDDTRTEFFVGFIMNLILLVLLFAIVLFVGDELLIDTDFYDGFYEAYVIAVPIVQLIFFMAYISAVWRRLRDTRFSPYWTFAVIVPFLQFVPWIMTFFKGEDYDEYEANDFLEEVHDEIEPSIFDELKLNTVFPNELGAEVLAAYLYGMLDGLAETYDDISMANKSTALLYMIQNNFDLSQVRILAFIKELEEHVDDNDDSITNRAMHRGRKAYKWVLDSTDIEIMSSYVTLYHKALETEGNSETTGLAGYRHKLGTPAAAVTEATVAESKAETVTPIVNSAEANYQIIDGSSTQSETVQEVEPEATTETVGDEFAEALQQLLGESLDTISSLETEWRDFWVLFDCESDTDSIEIEFWAKQTNDQIKLLTQQVPADQAERIKDMQLRLQGYGQNVVQTMVRNGDEVFATALVHLHTDLSNDVSANIEFSYTPWHVDAGFTHQDVLNYYLNQTTGALFIKNSTQEESQTKIYAMQAFDNAHKAAESGKGAAE